MALRDVLFQLPPIWGADMTVAGLTTIRSCGRHCLARSVVTCSIT
jgi:hypothetical protein